MLPHPFWRKINPSTISTLLDFLLNHLFTINLELGLIENIGWRREGLKVRFFSMYHGIPYLLNHSQLTISQSQCIFNIALKCCQGKNREK